MADPAFWNAQERAREVVQEVKQLKGWLDPFDKLVGRIRSAVELVELLSLEPDAEMEAEVEREATAIRDDVEAFELRSLLQGRDDFRDAQLEISAGAGGTEAQDWAQMLMRMYTRWAERKGFGVDIIDLSEGEEAGIKGSVLEIKGQYAYGFLRPESGVHRLVRISPFDSQARRHTSFASVFVYPVVNEEINIEIREEDLKIDVYRASGAGWPARQQDEFGRAHHPHPDRDRLRVAGAAFAVQEQGDGDEAAQEQALPARGRQARRGEGGDGCEQAGRVVRQPDPQLRLPAVHDGERPPDGAEADGCPQGDGRGIDPFIREYLKQNGAPGAGAQGA
jgi:hypothetical protein